MRGTSHRISDYAMTSVQPEVILMDHVKMIDLIPFHECIASESDTHNSLTIIYLCKSQRLIHTIITTKHFYISATQFVLNLI